MKKLGLLLVLAVALVSCKEAPQATVQSGNFQVEYLFENDGCKAYRFQDGGRYIYYTDCSGKTEYSYSSGGKNSTTKYQECSTSK